MNDLIYNLMIGREEPGISLEDNVTFVEVDGIYSIIEANSNNKAYKFKYHGKTVEINEY